jgi:uncharacterized membrane protein YphA (DoxX/SURF4 family)
MEHQILTEKSQLLEGFGRIFIAIAMVGFGIQHWLLNGIVGGLELVPEGLPGHTIWADLIGTILVAAGVSLAIGKGARLSSMVLANLFFLAELVRRMPSIATIVQDLAERTVVFETLALGSGCLIVASVLPVGEQDSARWTKASQTAGKVGRILFAIAMAVFGWTHLLIPQFIATLIPSWMPWHLFLAYFTAFGFIAVGIAFASNRAVRPAAGLLGLMFLSWVITLHGPRVALALSNRFEWNSAFMALAMSGVAFVVAGARDPVQAAAPRLVIRSEPALGRRAELRARSSSGSAQA